VPPVTSTGCLFDDIMSWLIRSLAFQLKVRRNEHFTRRAVASLPVCHWHSSPIVLRCSYFGYIQFLTLICLISHQIASCPMSHCQETRFKDFLFNPKWISYQISSFFALIDALQVILFQLLFLLPEISKLKFSKTKSPRIDPFVSFIFVA
jgi:hypothetical protein